MFNLKFFKMKKLIVVCIFAFLTLGVSAQDKKIDVKKGDVFKIASPSGQEFKHINFPKKNFIIKRGGIANDKLVYGEEVIVTSVALTKDGSTEIRLKPKDGGKFYNAIRSVKVDFEDAIQTGELIVL